MNETRSYDRHLVLHLELVSTIISTVARSKDERRAKSNTTTYRAISLAELADGPTLLIHVPSESALEHVSVAQSRMLPIHAETCSHLLFLLSGELKGGTDSNGINDAHEHNYNHDHHDDHDVNFRGAKTVCPSLSGTILLISIPSGNM